jgi:hypothetical protein
VTDEEMQTVRAIERWFAKWFPEKIPRKKIPREQRTCGDYVSCAQRLQFLRPSAFLIACIRFFLPLGAA